MARFESETQYRGYKLRLDVSEASYSTQGNSSDVNWTLYIVNGYKDGTYYRFNANFHFSVTIDGVQRATYDGNVNTTDVGSGQAHKLSSGSFTVEHNSDGTKSISCSAECSKGGPLGPGDGSCSGTMALTVIPRAASINTFNGDDIDGNFVAGYTKYVDNWKYYLRLTLPNNTQIHRAEYVSGTTFKLTEEEKDIIYSGIGDNDTVNISAVIETYNGSTKVGESSVKTNTCNVNRNMYLKVSGTWKRGIPYIKVNGEWKKGVPYIKINGEWKKAI